MACGPTTSLHICNSTGVYSNLEALALPNRFTTAFGNATVFEPGGKIAMKLPPSQSDVHLTVHDLDFIDDALADLLRQGTLIERGWNMIIKKEDSIISQPWINIAVYKTGPGGTLRAFKLPSKNNHNIPSTAKSYFSSWGQHHHQEGRTRGPLPQCPKAGHYKRMAQ